MYLKKHMSTHILKYGRIPQINLEDILPFISLSFYLSIYLSPLAPLLRPLPLVYWTSTELKLVISTLALDTGLIALMVRFISKSLRKCGQHKIKNQRQSIFKIHRVGQRDHIN